mgnify:CR=1 FL=1
MLTVTNAWNQHGWDSLDHLLDDSALTDMIGRTYTNLAALKRAAQHRAESYPTVEYHDGHAKYCYRGDPTGIPGRHVVVVQEIGPL